MRLWSRPVVLGATLFALAACNANPSSGPPPVTALNAKQCSAAAPSPRRLVLLGADKSVNVDVDAAAVGCARNADGTRRIELVFELPNMPEPYLLTVTSFPVGTTIFAPRLAIRDKDGRVTREFGGDHFRLHGKALSAVLRALPEDRYLVVLSDPRAVGQRSTQISEGTNHTFVPVGAGFFVVNTGVEATVTYTAAYNGRINVTAEPWPHSDPIAGAAPKK